LVPHRRLAARRLAAIVGAGALLGGACGGSSGDNNGAAESTATTALAAASAGATTTPTTAVPEAFGVGTREETYVDSSRPTAPNGDYAGAPDRTLRVRFFYPTDAPPGPDTADAAEPAATGRPFPIILFSHGWIAVPEVYARLAHDIAARGYLLVLPAYPLSRGGAPGGPTPEDVVNQPADASFVLDQVLAAATDDASWLSGVVDGERIGAAGHSLGGMTTYGLVYNSCCLDERIDAAAPISAMARPFRGTFFEGIDTPLLHIHGDQDEVLRYDRGLEAWELANDPKYFVTILRGKHASDELGGDSPAQQVVTNSLIDFFDAYLRDRTGALDDLARVGNTPDVASMQQSP
jgi:dienelactone hydrolase